MLVARRIVSSTLQLLGLVSGSTETATGLVSHSGSPVDLRDLFTNVRYQTRQLPCTVTT